MNIDSITDEDVTEYLNGAYESQYNDDVDIDEQKRSMNEELIEEKYF